MNERPATTDPSTLARFGRLELVARLVVEGVMAGLHCSPFKGASVEFAEHRQYGPGDEIRHIDWRAYGKTDRYFVKEFEESTSLTAYLAVDTSASMAYQGKSSSVTKLEQARRLSASLAHLMIGQRDTVGLATSETVDDPIRLIPPRSTPGHLPVLCQALDASTPLGEIPMSRVLHSLAARARRRGLIVIVSDAFEPVANLVSALRHLRHRHHEVLFFQVLDPDEVSFPFHGRVTLRDLEQPGRRIEPAGDPFGIRARYLARFEAFDRELRDSLQGLGIDHVRALTSEPVERILLDYLAARVGRGRGRSTNASAGG